MRLKKFGVFAVIAALIVAGFASCGKEEAPAPQLQLRKSDGTTLKELTKADVDAGFSIYVTPGKADKKPVGMKGKLKASYTLSKGEGQSDVKSPEKLDFDFGKITSEEKYVIKVTKAELKLSDPDLAAAANGKFTFEATDDNGKVGSLTVNYVGSGKPGPTPTPDKGTPMTLVEHDGTKQGTERAIMYINHGYGGGLGGIALKTGEPVSYSASNADIYETSTVAGTFKHEFASKTGCKFRKLGASDLGGMTFDNITCEKATELAAGAVDTKVIANKDDLILVVKNDELYLIKVVKIIDGQIWGHTNNPPKLRKSGGESAGKDGSVQITYKKGTKVVKK